MKQVDASMGSLRAIEVRKLARQWDNLLSRTQRDEKVTVPAEFAGRTARALAILAGHLNKQANQRDGGGE